MSMGRCFMPLRAVRMELERLAVRATRVVGTTMYIVVKRNISVSHVKDVDSRNCPDIMAVSH